jgi:myo-inositol-1(or 4)-monophosphatase
MLREEEIEFALKCAKEAAKIGGEIIRKYFFEGRSELEMKGISDWVTEADRVSEKKIKKFLLENFPADFLGEEFGEEKSQKKYEKKMRWIVDPLDGTKNFTKKIAYFCVSIALEVDGKIEIGVVYSPIENEMFWSIREGGAFLNDKKIRVSENENFESAFLGTGFPFKTKVFIEKYLETFKEFFFRGGSIRNFGSAALELCYVACGRLDGFWEIGLSPWDMAAGALIVKEAGGKVTDFWGEDFWLDTGTIVASNGKIHDILVKITSQAFGKF